VIWLPGRESTRATFKDSNGNPVKDHAKYVVIGKKQSTNGSGKVIADTYNSDVPLTHHLPNRSSYRPPHGPRAENPDCETTAATISISQAALSSDI